MKTQPSLPSALRHIRKIRGLSQEDFSDTSSRTYMSSLERGLKSPTLKKLEELCAVMEVHPITLLTTRALDGVLPSTFNPQNNFQHYYVFPIGFYLWIFVFAVYWRFYFQR